MAAKHLSDSNVLDFAPAVVSVVVSGSSLPFSLASSDLQSLSTRGAGLGAEAAVPMENDRAELDVDSTVRPDESRPSWRRGFG